MRLYSFQCFYFAGIHAGIQTAHSVAEIAVKYQNPKSDTDKVAAHNFHLWAQDHKTIIVKNGGMAGDLRNLIELLELEDNPHPWAYFKESEYAADGCLTNVSLVVPTNIWMLADALRRPGNYTIRLGNEVYAVMDLDTGEYVDMGEEDGGALYREHGCFSLAQSTIHHYIYNKGTLPKSPNMGPDQNRAYVKISEFNYSLIKHMNKCGLM